ncbi:beta-galactosidase [Vagococcus penaei]|uniref:Beta-galactosidase n=1 Tax=Vagococcus penaei TaxID=633807 RepID=A0A1Q2D3F4_9ENTE|nr:beta-galactosidase family protein [Vagococcus penaei]AQP52896.1 beta-galactosidase [Vagococcus penaei]RSU01385.1 beta-galactosidase [Vagococcus penaei]
MNTIKISKDFLINGKPVKLISGAIHYFRIMEDYWEDSLEKLKEMGCNTVETYIPWNFHEQEENQFDFTSPQHNIVKFIKLAEQKGLYVIARPSPYICAEWEFGGLPYWLLTKKLKIRSSDPNFIAYVERYYSRLFDLLTPLQWNKNGPIILLQLENEYGSYGNDKTYLAEIHRIMLENNVSVPIFTSDGSWEEALEAGYLPNSQVFPTGNFGSNASVNIAALKSFMTSKNIIAPLMCMEFWDGWFNRWNEPVVKRNPIELRDSVKEMYDLGSLNLYMFHGGTNFGFMNGCSARGTMDLHQVTSYDYDAPLTECGDITEKYYELKELFTGSRKVNNQKIRNHAKRAYSEITYIDSVSLFDVLDSVSKPVVRNSWPLPMEDLNHGYGYILYQSIIGNARKIDKVRIIEASDRVKVYLNQKEQITQLKKEIGTEFSLNLPKKTDNQLAILVENMGRVNYGTKLTSPTQRKGIRNGVMLDLHFHADWAHYCLDFTKLATIDFSKDYQGGVGFHKFELITTDIADTYIDCRGFGKGCIFVNGVNLGRFWQVGPAHSLYLPAPILKQGVNDIIIFETEGIYQTELKTTELPIIDTI